jgi:glycosyltransferase involved in cell wall biosynthesis
MKNKLIFFTAEYPYGNKSETFIENEINFLAEKFQEVVLIPSYKSEDNMRILPSNVTVNNIFIHDLNYKRKKIFFKYFFQIINIFFYESFVFGNFLNYLNNCRYYVDLLCIQFNKFSLLQNLVSTRTISSSDVLYDFWYSNSSIALALLRKSGKKNRIVIRAHRYDLYDEESEAGRVPFRKFISINLTKVVFSNTHGKEYFLSKVPNIDLEKISVNYLGVYDKNVKKREEKILHYGFTIVSCSGISQRKRVELIPQILKKINRNITWIHFGDGCLMNQLKEQCMTLPSNIKYILKGHVDNQAVIEFYQRNHVDLFVSFTTSEGLPVSFKEAISFGIPIFSTNVCGIPDIVNKTTGVMIDVNEDIESIAKKIEEVIDSYKFNEDDIKDYFRKNFLAESVYSDFIDSVLLE